MTTRQTVRVPFDSGRLVIGHLGGTKNLWRGVVLGFQQGVLTIRHTPLHGHWYVGILSGRNVVRAAGHSGGRLPRAPPPLHNHNGGDGGYGHNQTGQKCGRAGTDHDAHRVVLLARVRQRVWVHLHFVFVRRRLAHSRLLVGAGAQLQSRLRRLAQPFAVLLAFLVAHWPLCPRVPPK